MWLRSGRKRRNLFSLIKYAGLFLLDFLLSHPLSQGHMTFHSQLFLWMPSLFMSLAHKHISLSFLRPILPHMFCLWHSLFSWCIYQFANWKSTAVCQWRLCLCWSPHFKTRHTFSFHVAGLNQIHGMNCTAISRVNISSPAVHISTPWADNCAWMEIWKILFAFDIMFCILAIL